jgi:hypothetical protein
LANLEGVTMHFNCEFKNWNSVKINCGV